jgi:predicted O-methyltransferase YrrM
MLQRLSSEAQMIVAGLFSLIVGVSAGLYALWPENIKATSRQPTAATATACAAFQPQGKDYQFKFGDYFSTENRLDWWNEHLKPLAYKPINYLEVGIYEGRSMLWMLDNVLKHPDSTATGIDVLIRSHYMENLVRSGACEKVTNLRGRSQDILHTLPKSSFDVIYIDGSHLGQDVLVDAVLSFELLKVGGLLIFDDYKWYTDWASEIRPGIAIDSFVTMYRNQLQFVHRGYQLVVKKREHPCAFNPYRFSPVGSYCYQWVTNELVRQSDRKEVRLLPGEKEIIEEIARSAPFGEIDPMINDAMRSRSDFQALNKRLGVFPPLN